jgi:histidine triad (HIT) family protein
MSQDCILCNIGSGDIPAEVLYRDNQALAIRDINQQAPVHLLVFPVNHFTNLSHTIHSFEKTVGHLLTVAAMMATRESIAEQGYRLVINHGNNAGQQIAHLHLHVLGGTALGPMG